jgi:hypothetical protein
MSRHRVQLAIRLGLGALVGAGVLITAPPAFASHGPNVNGAAKFGLCRAYSKGSAKGLAHKHKHSTAFKKLEAAAKAHSETVQAFCANAKPGNPTAEANRQGPPTSGPGTPTSLPNQTHANTHQPVTTSLPPHSNADGHGTPPKSVGGTDTANDNSHDGASLNGTTNADAASGGRSANGSNNAAAHRP